MNIKFIVPNSHENSSHTRLSREARLFPPLGLAKMAAIASARHSISYHDERIGKHDKSSAADIAIIFINSHNRLQAYKIASDYRNQGCHVVFTGAILEQSAEDAFSKADCLFIGSGEKIMRRFLEDFTNGRKRKLYGSMLNPIGSTETTPLQLAM